MRLGRIRNRRRIEIAPEPPHPDRDAIEIGAILGCTRDSPLAIQTVDQERTRVRRLIQSVVPAGHLVSRYERRLRELLPQLPPPVDVQPHPLRPVGLVLPVAEPLDA